MPALKLHVEVEKLRLSAPFRISGFVFEEQEVVVVTLDDGEHRGRSEASGVAAGARKFAQARSLKLKLTGDLNDDIERVRAVRAARPEVWMGVDANQGYGIDSLGSLIGVLESANVSLLEQPLKRGREAIGLWTIPMTWFQSLNPLFRGLYVGRRNDRPANEQS